MGSSTSRPSDEMTKLLAARCDAGAVMLTQLSSTASSRQLGGIPTVESFGFDVAAAFGDSIEVTRNHIIVTGKAQGSPAQRNRFKRSDSAEPVPAPKTVTVTCTPILETPCNAEAHFLIIYPGVPEPRLPTTAFTLLFGLVSAKAQRINNVVSNQNETSALTPLAAQSILPDFTLGDNEKSIGFGLFRDKLVIRRKGVVSPGGDISPLTLLTPGTLVTLVMSGTKLMILVDGYPVVSDSFSALTFSGPWRFGVTVSSYGQVIALASSGNSMVEACTQVLNKVCLSTTRHLLLLARNDGRGDGVTATPPASSPNEGGNEHGLPNKSLSDSSLSPDRSLDRLVSSFGTPNKETAKNATPLLRCVPKPDLTPKDWTPEHGFHFCHCPALAASAVEHRVALCTKSTTFTLVSSEVFDFRRNVPMEVHMKCIINPRGGNMVFGFVQEEPGEITAAAIGSTMLPKSFGIYCSDFKSFIVTANGVCIPGPKLQTEEVLMSFRFTPGATGGFQSGRFTCDVDGIPSPELSSALDAVAHQVIEGAVTMNDLNCSSVKNKRPDAEACLCHGWRIGVSLNTEGQLIFLGGEDEYLRLPDSPQYQSFVSRNQHSLNIDVTNRAKRSGFPSVMYHPEREVTLFAPPAFASLVQLDDCRLAALSLSDSPTTVVTTQAFKIPMMAQVTFRIAALGTGGARSAGLHVATTPQSGNSSVIGFGIIGKDAADLMTKMVGSDDGRAQLSVGLVYRTDLQRCKFVARDEVLEDDPQAPSLIRSFAIEDCVTLCLNGCEMEFYVNGKRQSATGLKTRKIPEGTEVRFAVTLAGVAQCVHLVVDDETRMRISEPFVSSSDYVDNVNLWIALQLSMLPPQGGIRKRSPIPSANSNVVIPRSNSPPTRLRVTSHRSNSTTMMDSFPSRQLTTSLPDVSFEQLLAADGVAFPYTWRSREGRGSFASTPQVWSRQVSNTSNAFDSPASPPPNANVLSNPTKSMLVHATDQIFCCRRFDSTRCNHCFQRPLFCTQWVCESIVLCDSCYRCVQANQYPTSLYVKHFRATLGGNFVEVKFRILDLAAFPVTVGLIPAGWSGATHAHGGRGNNGGESHPRPGSVDNSIGLTIRQENRTMSLWIAGHNVARFPPATPAVKVGSVVQIRLAGGKLQFLIDDTVISKHEGFCELYRFAVSLPPGDRSTAASPTNYVAAAPAVAASPVSVSFPDLSMSSSGTHHSGLIEVLPNAVRPRVGYVTVVSAPNKTVLVEEGKNCGINVADQWISQQGTCVATDDEDATVGLTFPTTAGKIVWFPRVCICQNLGVNERAPVLDIPPIRDVVVRRHPVHWRGGRGDGGGDDAETSAAPNAVPLGVVTDINTVSSRVEVKWENGDRTWHQWGGIENRFEVIVVVGKGCRVKRNPFYWMWGDQDGGGLGTVENLYSDGRLDVKWDRTKVLNRYRFGFDNKFDVQAVLIVAPPVCLTHAALAPQFGGTSAQTDCEDLSFRLPDGMAISRNAMSMSRGIGSSAAGEAMSYVSLLPAPMDSPESSSLGVNDAEANTGKTCMQIPFTELVVRRTRDREVGRGKFGKVWKWEWLEHGGGRLYAVKEIERQPTCKVDRLQEAALMSKLSHPHIVSVYGWSTEEDSGSVFIVMELIAGGDLAKLLRTKKHERIASHKSVESAAGGPLGWPLFFQVALGVASGLSYLASRRCAHRDLKPANILIDMKPGQLIPKITDFGLAKEQEQSFSSNADFVGTYAYLAPETVQKKPFGVVTDVYSFGAILWEMLSGKVPRADLAELAMIRAIADGTPLPQLEGVDEDLNNLIQACLDPDPTTRIRAEAVRQRLEELAQRFPST